MITVTSRRKQSMYRCNGNLRSRAVLFQNQEASNLESSGGTLNKLQPPPDGADQKINSEPPRVKWQTLAALLMGILMSGGVAGGTLLRTSTPPGSEIDQVAPADLDASATSFPRTELGTHVQDAKACRVPLSYVTLVPRNGSSGHVRIRSGDYWTPVIDLDASPVRVAIPYPAPYPAGIGELRVEGVGANFDMYLNPGWVGQSIQGGATVHVWWKVKAPC